MAAQYQRVLARSPERDWAVPITAVCQGRSGTEKCATHVAVRISRPMEGCTMHPSIVFHLWRASV